MQSYIYIYMANNVTNAGTTRVSWWPKGTKPKSIARAA